MFSEIQKDEAKFVKFSKNYARYLKVGIIEDKENRDALLKLATFESSDSGAPRHSPILRLPRLTPCPLLINRPAFVSAASPLTQPASLSSDPNMRRPHPSRPSLPSSLLSAPSLSASP